MLNIPKNTIFLVTIIFFVVILLNDLILSFSMIMTDESKTTISSILSVVSKIGLLSVLVFFTINNYWLKKENKILKIIVKKKRDEKKVLKNLLHLDELTKLFNRAGLDDWRKSSEKLLKTSTSNYSVIYLDIDHFKNINDNYGHPVGDRVLQQFADVLKRSCFSESNFAVRLGGEEFMIVCSKDKYNAEKIAKMVQLKMKEIQWEHNEKVTCSIGIADIQKEEGLRSAMKLADLAMYEAKKSGRNKIVIYEKEKKNKNNENWSYF